MDSNRDPRDRFLLLLPSGMFQHPALLRDHVVFHVPSLQLGLDFPQGCLLHHILKAAGFELGKEMKRTFWWLPPGDMDLQEQGISLNELF